MKKHWKTILTVLLLSALLPVILLATEWRLPSLYGESYYAELSAMTERLYSVQGKKLVLVGGSNIAFGVDGNLLENLLAEKGFDYTVCPFGLYAALGTGAMLSLSEDALCPGDLVVLAMEPTAETLSCYFGAGAFWKCAETAPSLLMALKPAQRAAAAGSYIGYLQERTAIVRSQEWPRPEGAYRKDSFDADCTMRFVREGNTMPLGYDYADPIDLNALEIPADFAEEVNRYIQKAEKNGAQVVLSFSPMNRSAMTDVSEAVVWKYFSLCNDVFRCPVISDPNNYILDCGWFFDNNVHLNSAGAELRTYNLARDIFAFLGCYEPVEEEPLTMPASVAEPEDNAADNRFFVFAPTADNAAWIIWGLTDEGKKQTTLTAPSQYCEKPVIALSEDALKDAQKLEELRLPGSIALLPGGLFEACPAISRLILEHSDRPCGLAEDALRGADQLRIYVPAEAYVHYRDGHGCENNPWTPYLSRIFTF